MKHKKRFKSLNVTFLKDKNDDFNIGDLVEIHYTVMFKNGEIFDSTRYISKFQFVLNQQLQYLIFFSFINLY